MGTLSWTLPYCVPTASLVTVFVAVDDDEDADPEVLGEVDGDREVLVDVAGAAAAVAVAAVVADSAWRALKPSVVARPSAVAPRTMGARVMVMVMLRVRRRRTRDAGGTSALRPAARWRRTSLGTARVRRRRRRGRRCQG